MEPLHKFTKRVITERPIKIFPVLEGGTKPEEELYKEYISMERTTQAMISFEGFCEMRKLWKP